MFKWLNRTPEKSLVAEPQKQSTGFFTTRTNITARDQDDFLAVVQSQVFQKTHKDIKVVSTGDATMDAKHQITLDSVNFNTAFSIGTTIPPAQIGWYASQSFIGYQMCATLSQQWLIDKACTMPAQDAIRQGWQLTANDGEEIDTKVFDYIKRLDVKYKVSANLLEYERMGRIYGIRICMFDISSTDPKYYEKPFNIDGITPGCYKGIIQIDPMWIVPELDMDAAANPMSKHFYEPTYWQCVGGVLGTLRIHRSHLIIMTLGEMPDILKPTYLYGSPSIPQRIYDRVYAAERTANEAPLLAQSKRTNVVHVDMDQVTANPLPFMKRIQQWINFRNNEGIKILGKDEVLEQFETSLTDLDAVIMTQYQLVAAIAGTPATKLLGTSPKGFGASGEYEQTSYREMLESIQEHHLTPLLDRHYLIMMRSDILPKFKTEFCGVVVWEALNSQTSEEESKTELNRAKAANFYFQSGALTGVDIRKRLTTDEESGYSGLGIDDEPPPPPTDPATKDVKVLDAINENIKNLSGRQHQTMQRIIRQHGQGKLNDDQANTLLKGGLGLSDAEIKSLLGTQEDGTQKESGGGIDAGVSPSGGSSAASPAKPAKPSRADRKKRRN